MARTVKLDHAGIAKLLRSDELGRAVHDAATEVAGRVRAQATVTRHDADVVVDDYVTDRRASSVTIAHPAGLAMQAKHGALTRSVR